MTSARDHVAQAYTRTAQRTVDAGPTLLVRLYDRLAHELELAKEFIAAGDAAGANASLQHAQKIVHVLRSALDPAGFEGGETLQCLYNSLIEWMVQANLHKDVTWIVHCQEVVAPLHAAWREAVAVELERSAASGAPLAVG